MAYAMGYGFGVDKDLVYDFLLGVGDAINATGLEVVKKKVKFKIVHNKYLVMKIKVKLADGTKMKFKKKEKINCTGRLVMVDADKMGGNDDPDMTEEVLKQLEAAMGKGEATKKEEPKKQIGFKLD